MGEWQDRQVGYGALCSICFWVAGVGMILAAIIGVAEDPWANLGNVLFVTGCLRTVLGVIRHQEHRVHDAFEMGREVTLHLVRDEV